MGMTADPVVFGDDEEEAARLLAEPAWSETDAGRILDEAGTDAALEGLRGFVATPDAEPFRRTQTAGADAPPVRTAEDYQRARDTPPQAGEWPFQGQDPRGAVDAMPPQRVDPEQQAQARVEALRALQQPGEWFAGASSRARTERTPDAPQEAGEAPRVEPVGDRARIPSETPRGSDGTPTPGKRAGEQWAAGPRGTLDEDLPGEDAISRTQAEEIPLRILRALGAGFLGAVGRQAPNRPLPSEELRQRRTQGLETRMRAKSGERERELGADEQMRRQRAIDARQAQGIEAQSARDALSAQQREADRAVREQQIGIGQQRVRLSAEEQQREQAERERMASVESRESRVARVAIQARRAQMPPEMQAELDAAVAEIGGYEALTAADVQSLIGEGRALPNPVTPRDTRRRGSGGGRIGGGTPDGEGLIESAVEMGMPEEAARAMRPRDLARMLATEGAQRTRRTAQTEAGEEILPGVIAGIDLDRGEGRALRTGFTQARTQYASLGEIDRIAQRYGASGVISPEVAGELGGPLSRLRAMVAQLQNTGVINPSEAPAIEAMLPDPRSLAQMTFGTLQGRLASFRRELESAVESELVARGVADDGIDTALGYLRGGRVARGGGSSRGGGDSAQPQAGGTVRVRRTSDGSVREVPRAAWERASAEQRAQYEEVP
jgi:hypothetical protein